MLPESRIQELADSCFGRDILNGGPVLFKSGVVEALRTAACEAAIAENEAWQLLEMVPHHLRGLLKKCPHYTGTANLLAAIEAAIRARREGL